MNYKSFLINLFTIPLLFISCIRDSADVISGGNFRYWLHYINEDSYRIKSYYYFDNEGRWTMFHYDRDKFRKVKYDDDIPNEYWSVNNDSILTFDNKEYIISYLSDKKIILKRNKVYDTLYAIPEDSIPYKYRRKWDFYTQVNIVDRLYKTKIDSLYSENMKYLYNVLLEQKYITKNDTLNFYIDDKYKRNNNRRIRKMIGYLPITIKDQRPQTNNTFIINPPKYCYGQILFQITIPRKVKEFDKDKIGIYYDYELDEYYMDTMNMSWIL